MSSLRRALVGLAVLAVGFAAVDAVLIATSGHEDDDVVTAVLGPFIGVAFVGTGLFAWARRPTSRFGALMTGVGFAWLAAGLTYSDDALVFSLGSYLSPLYIVLLGHMLIAFPTGRISTTAGRAVVATGYLNVLVLLVPYYVLGGRFDAVPGAPDNAFAIWDEPDAAAIFESVAQLVGAGLVAALFVLLVRKRQLASPPQRRAMAPVLWTGLVLALILTATLTGDLVGTGNVAQTFPGLTALIAFAFLPFAFLLGLARSRYTRAGAVSELVERLNEGATVEHLRDALARALGDRSLQLVYWSRQQERYVDGDGRPVPLPPGRGRMLTEVRAPGATEDTHPIAAIVHDTALGDEPGIVRAAGAAAALALENERLEAELRARVAELQTSRRKLIEVGMHERRALERNLHDGAQQRLVALSLQLGLAKGKVRKDPDAAEQLLDAAREELAAALEELRELARGIHPAILTDRGLGPALEMLAGRAPVPVEVEAVPMERLPVAVEAAAYFVVAESLTNLAKYADAGGASVRAIRQDAQLVVEVQDDGRGGADPSAGSGLRGLADRVAALDGRLDVVSPPGEGTLVRAVLPF
ncbi:histidine kinase [Conexibacter sp. SYSU D00693]|uniref:sensor histidine kinase n=1 Tax=Conexibacter sp. SYSU D00693 TaxID=2812560 RepID=UPI00196AFD32|nr:histidine kinase [Conexibacter sp. SYSU D00693]